MIKAVIIVLAAVVPVAPVAVYFWSMRGHDRIKGTKDLIFAFKSFNAVLVLMGVGLGVAWLLSPQTVLAASTTLLQQAATADPYASLAAGVSTGLAALGAGLGVSGTGAAAIGAIAEKPEMLGRSLIFVGLAEGVAIYGLLIAFLVLFR